MKRYRRPMRFSRRISKGPRPGVCTTFARGVRVMTGDRKQGQLGARIAFRIRKDVKWNKSNTFPIQSVEAECDCDRGRELN